MAPRSTNKSNELDSEKTVNQSDQTSFQIGGTATAVEDVLESVDDPILAIKINLVNEAINEIGWTMFHFKLSCLTGFGFAVDSLVAFLQSVAAVRAYLEIGNGGFSTGSTIALYAGLLVGALFWGFGADMIGRRIAFNTTLIVASVATVVSGAAPNWAVFCLFIAFLGFGAGGNLVLDPAIMLEFVPKSKQWVITAMAAWWGVGQSCAGFIAWGYYSRSDWTCDGTDCTWNNNKAWRLVMFTGGAVVLIMSLLRILAVRLPETPKYLVSAGEDAKLVAVLQDLAAKHYRSCTLTLEMLQAVGTIEHAASSSPAQKGISRRVGSSAIRQAKGLFSTTRVGISTSLIWLSWACIGLGYPLFFLYLPALLSSRVPDYEPTFVETWRDYTITNVCSIFGPLIAAGLVDIKALGRKYTMSIGAIMTAAFFFGYTAVRTPAQNLALSSCIAVCINLYYGTLYAYTAEIFPSAYRGTGNGIAVAINRLMGLLSAIIAVAADSATAVPLYISAALFIILAIVSAILPFEAHGINAS